MHRFRHKLQSAIRRKLSNNRGIAFPIILGFSFIFSIEIASIGIMAGSTQKQVSDQENRMKTFFMTEAATQKAVAQILHYTNNSGTAPNQAALDQLGSLPLSTGNYYAYQGSNGSGYTLTQNGNPQVIQLTEGNFAGLNATVQTIDVSVDLASINGTSSNAIQLTQSVQVQQIPLFQFGVFYEQDLEIRPGPPMTVTGPVHTNSNLYLGSNKGLTFDGQITSANDILHERKQGTSGWADNGEVKVKDDDGNFVSMKVGTDWMDVNHPDWMVGSQTLWDENVKSKSHDVKEINVPIPTGADAHTLIERRDPSDSDDVKNMKIDYKADIRIIDGQVMDQSGNSINFNYCKDGGGNYIPGSNPSNCAAYGGTLVKPIKRQTFYNYRELSDVRALRINLAQLQKSPAFSAFNNGSGVIIYHSDPPTTGVKQNGVRLVGGSKLPTGGLTVASSNPLYIKGDYNIDNPNTAADEKQPAGIMADAFHVQSNAWRNNKSSKDINSGDRTASETTMNLAVMAGTSPTKNNKFGGGYQNGMRFMEHWSKGGSKTFHFKGSFISLWDSQIATGLWKTGQVFKPPTRDFQFDEDFMQPGVVVPGFPSVINIVTSEWQQDT